MPAEHSRPPGDMKKTWLQSPFQAAKVPEIVRESEVGERIHCTRESTTGAPPGLLYMLRLAS
jgi:hypothetical protein